MIRSLILLAQELGMKVIVEGIETEEQLRVIKEIGANEVQGYLLGRPTPNPAKYLPHQIEAVATGLIKDVTFSVSEKLEIVKR